MDNVPKQKAHNQLSHSLNRREKEKKSISKYIHTCMSNKIEESGASIPTYADERNEK